MNPITYESIYDVSVPGQLVVENIRGAVVIQAGEADKISVTAVLHPGSGDESVTRVEITQQDNGTVKAMTRYEHDGVRLLAGQKPCKVEYTIVAPPRCDIVVRCVSSNLVVEGIDGKIGLDTVSGGMALRSVSGDLSFNTVSGSISGVGLNGVLTIKTVSGDVSLDEAEFSSIKASSVSGDFKLDGPLGVGPYHFNTVSGDVRLVVPPDTGCEIAMSTFSGDLRVGVSAIYHKRSAHVRQVTVLDGGTEIYMHSMSGDLVLISADGESGRDRSDAAATDQPTNQAETMSILDRIASGELSVEEGIRLIEEG